MPFIDERDEPVLLASRVNGKPGFTVLPQGEDEDAIHFTSREALQAWVAHLVHAAAGAEHVPTYEQWLWGEG